MSRAHNTTNYADRGWCCFEEGVALFTMTHLQAAEDKAAERGNPVHEALALAQKSRPKLTELSATKDEPRKATSEPIVRLLQRTIDAVSKATFTGKGDKEDVIKMLHEFEWDMKASIDSVQADALSEAFDPHVLGSQVGRALTRARTSSTVLAQAAADPTNNKRAPRIGAACRNLHVHVVV